MKARIRLIFLAFGVLVVTQAGNAQTVEVFQWTDENGVLHFSQWSPGDAVENVETVSLVGGGELDNGIGISEDDDPEGYQAHREEMEALWADIEARRKAERERQARQPSTEIVYVYDQPEYGYPYFFPGSRLKPPHHQPGRPPLLPQPRPGGPDEDEVTPPLRSVPYKRP